MSIRINPASAAALATDGAGWYSKISASAHENEEPWPKKTKVTTWVSRDVLRALRDVAAAHKLTVSQVAAEILERGLKERAETAGLGLLGPASRRRQARGRGKKL